MQKLLTSTHKRILIHVCEFQFDWMWTFDEISKNPVFNFEIPSPARVYYPFYQHSAFTICAGQQGPFKIFEVPGEFEIQG